MKQKKPLAHIISPDEFGVSFSLKQCAAFGLPQKEVLSWLLQEAGFRRFRLMSYWNEHEKQAGKYDFSALDEQIEMITEAGGVITLCLGARQPRWPENHWPDWAWEADKTIRSEALLRYIKVVVKRYKDNPAVISWQLENEALLKKFGRRPEVDRKRLRKEYQLIRNLSDKPIIMTTSNGWGIPMLGPIPTIVGFSYYPIMFVNGKYKNTVQKPWLHKLRKGLIEVLYDRKVFIHELQLEPWGPTAIWKMPTEEQNKSMSTEHIAKNIALARKINAYPVDLWGAEWWYWRLSKHSDQIVWKAVQKATSGN